VINKSTSFVAVTKLSQRRAVKKTLLHLLTYNSTGGKLKNARTQNDGLEKSRNEFDGRNDFRKDICCIQVDRVKFQNFPKHILD